MYVTENNLKANLIVPEFLLIFFFVLLLLSMLMENYGLEVDNRQQ